MGDVSGPRLGRLAAEQGTEGGDKRKGRGSASMASSLCLDCSQQLPDRCGHVRAEILQLVANGVWEARHDRFRRGIHQTRSRRITSVGNRVAVVVGPMFSRVIWRFFDSPWGYL